MKIHKSITAERIESALRESLCGTENPGFCIACGADADSVEPDATPENSEYECEECGKRAVFGVQALAMVALPL